MARTTDAPKTVSATTVPTPRKEASSSQAGLWQEHFVDRARASLTAGVGAAVTRSLSYVCVPDFGTSEECAALREAALTRERVDERRPHVMAASRVNFNCTRYSVETLLDRPARDASAAFLTRLLHLMETDDALCRIVTHGGDGLRRQNATNAPSRLRATWYTEPDGDGVMHPEPKVNIYQQGGFFKQHTDGMQLTLLVVLNDGYEGGGTAFFPDDDDEEEEERATDRPATHFARPPAGTAIVWGRDLLHMALPVTKGMRAVYVGSFDLNEQEE